jgi:hypothetical protein
MTDTEATDMPDVRKSIPALLASFPDNHAGLIRPQQARDLVVSLTLRSPADWFYRFAGSPSVGQATWNGTDTVQINTTDGDSVDRSLSIAAIAFPAALVRIVDLTSGAYLAAQVQSASVLGGVWTFAVRATNQNGVFSSGDPVSVQLFPSPAPDTAGSAYSAQNKDTSAIPAGTPVAVHTSGSGVVPADASTIATPAVGLMRDATNPSAFGLVQIDGLLSLADWSVVTGASSLPSRALFLLGSSAPGQLTTAAPTTPGQAIQPIGRAVGPQTLLLQIGQPLIL